MNGVFKRIEEDLQKSDLPKVKFEYLKADFSSNANMEYYTGLVDKITSDKDRDYGIMIINAGIMIAGNFEVTTSKQIKDTIDVNVYQYGIFSQAFLSILNNRYKNTKKRGALILVSSAAGYSPIAGTSVYSATKAFTTYLACCMDYE